MHLRSVTAIDALTTENGKNNVMFCKIKGRK